MIYYWWMWYVLHNQPQYPNEFVQLSLAIFLASIGGLIANISMKVSMHAIAAGVMVTFVMLLGFSQDLNFGIIISGSIFLAGAVCTARFIDSDHTPKEIYTGLFIGIGALISCRCNSHKIYFNEIFDTTMWIALVIYSNKII